jgi:hypothetical protein
MHTEMEIHPKEIQVGKKKSSLMIANLYKLLLPIINYISNKEFISGIYKALQVFYEKINSPI